MNVNIQLKKQCVSILLHLNAVVQLVNTIILRVISVKLKPIVLHHQPRHQLSLLHPRHQQVRHQLCRQLQPQQQQQLVNLIDIL